MNKNPTALYVITEDWAFLHHRIQIAGAVRAAGFDVVVCCPEGPRVLEIEARGYQHAPVRIDRRNLNPVSELPVLTDLVKVYRSLNPDVVHHFAFKPIVHGTTAARIAGVPAVVNSVTGLGYVFIGDGLKRRLLRNVTRALFTASLHGRRVRTVFQNSEDLSLFVRMKMVSLKRATLIRGSGVDVERFKPRAEPDGDVVVLLGSRMLWDKGIGELVEAVRVLQAEGLRFKVQLAGIPDPRNPASIPEETLNEWVEQGLVEWLGYRRDMDDLLAACHIACLPSYREGLPLFLLEAAASSRAIITADTTGCREVVQNGKNGLLVPVRDASALTNALRTLINDAPLRREMGARGRAMVETEFSVATVGRQTVELYQSLIRAT